MKNKDVEELFKIDLSQKKNVEDRLIEFYKSYVFDPTQYDEDTFDDPREIMTDDFYRKFCEENSDIGLEWVSVIRELFNSIHDFNSIQ